MPPLNKQFFCLIIILKISCKLSFYLFQVLSLQTDMRVDFHSECPTADPKVFFVQIHDGLRCMLDIRVFMRLVDDRIVVAIVAHKDPILSILL